MFCETESGILIPVVRIGPSLVEAQRPVAEATPGIQILLTIQNNCCLAGWGLDF